MSDDARGRIVITGMGMVSPLASGVEATWARMKAGRSGLRRLDDAMVPDVDAKVAGVVPTVAEDPDGFDLDAIVPVKDRKKMDRFIAFALQAANEALKQAGWIADSCVGRKGRQRSSRRGSAASTR